MTNGNNHDKAWNVSVTNYGEYEYHALSKEELRDILHEEWSQEFNGFFVGRDIDCVGRLGVFFYHDDAYVAYEDFENGAWWCSYDPLARAKSGWDELIRLTPDDTQDYSFIRCSLISKGHAMEIVDRYLNSGQVEGLYLLDQDGRPRQEGSAPHA